MCTQLCFHIEAIVPRQVISGLGIMDIFTWGGNEYALLVSESLGLEESGGRMRFGPAHYPQWRNMRGLGSR